MKFKRELANYLASCLNDSKPPGITDEQNIYNILVNFEESKNEILKCYKKELEK